MKKPDKKHVVEATETFYLEQVEVMTRGLFGLSPSGKLIWQIINRRTGRMVSYEAELFDAINKAIKMENDNDNDQ